MTAFQSNINSVRSALNFQALKKRLTTCLKNWRLQHQKQQQSYHQHQESFTDLSIINRTCKNINALNKNLKHLISKTKKRKKGINSKKPTQEVIAEKRFSKLLSSTLLTTFTTINTTVTTTTHISHYTPHKGINMTILDESLLRIQKEHPELNKEVRSILLAHAQNGVTIADIKTEYYKFTGHQFPVSESATEYLLSIPNVTAYCDDKGTRIFNIRPKEETQHLYDMVMQQKPVQNFRSDGARSSTSSSSLKYGFRNQANVWRNCNQNSYNYNHQRKNFNNYYHSGMADENYQQRQQQQHQQHQIEQQLYFQQQQHQQQQQQQIEYQRMLKMQQQQHQQQSSQQQLCLNEETDALIRNNNFYEDNCNYLYNRFCNPNQYVQPPVMMNSNLLPPDQNMNNFNNLNANNLANYSNFNNFIQQHYQQTYQSQPLQPELPYQQNILQLEPIYQSHGLQQELRNNRQPLRSLSPAETKSTQFSESLSTQDSNYEAHLLDFPLVGDDFFLYLARMELKCKFRKNERVLQSGFCVSGQTIKAAISRINQLQYGHRRFIVNIGSVDIMKGRSLLQVQHDFRALIDAMDQKGIKPIITTLAPLANYSHDLQIKTKLERFNDYLKREYRLLIVIDIWSCLVNEKHQTRFDCFQNEPRNVTGASEPYVFWNNIGRQRVLQMIESQIEY